MHTKIINNSKEGKAMNFQSAQERYDNMQPDEPPEGHFYTGDVYLDKHGYFFRFEGGKIVSFSFTDSNDQECFNCPMAAYTGNDEILNEADEIAFGEWIQECREARNDF